VEFEYHVCPHFKSALTNFQADRLDIQHNLMVAPERERFAIYVQPHGLSSSIIVTLTDMLSFSLCFALPSLRASNTQIFDLSWSFPNVVQGGGQADGRFGVPALPVHDLGYSCRPLVEPGKDHAERGASLR